MREGRAIQQSQGDSERNEAEEGQAVQMDSGWLCSSGQHSLCFLLGSSMSLKELGKDQVLAQHEY